MNEYYIIDLAVLTLLLVSAILVVRSCNLLYSVMLFAIFSLLMSLMYLIMGAPDVAITEAAVGACLGTVLFLSVLLVTGEKQAKPRHPLAPLTVILIVGAALFFATIDMPHYADATAPAHQHVAPYYIEQTYRDMGIPNMVTGVLASYRGWDTLGEVTVILTAGLSVLLLLSTGRNKKK